MVAWADFEKMKASGLGNVRQMQSEACAKIIRQNRHYVKTVAEVLLLTAMQ